MEPMHKINKVEVRNLQIEDYAQLSQSFKMRKSWDARFPLLSIMTW